MSIIVCCLPFPMMISYKRKILNSFFLLYVQATGKGIINKFIMYF